MKDTNVNVNEMNEEFYLYGNCLAKERITIVRTLNQEGKQIDVKIVVKPGANKAEFFDTQGNKLGLIMTDTDRSYSSFRAKEPSINTVLTAQELIDKVGDAEIDAVAITALSVGVLKIRVNLDPNAVVKTESTTPVVKPIDAADFDLSAFSPDDATQVRARMNYIIGEGFLFIICILALILGVGFINGLITQKGDSSSESKRITKDFGCMGTILIISVIIVLLYQCS
jgi:hypothetical protein